MRARALIICAPAFAVVAVIAGLFATSGEAEQGRQHAPLSGKITVTGTPIQDLSAGDLSVLEIMQRSGATVYELGVIDDRAYYKITHPTQVTCYGAGPVFPTEENGRFGNVHCDDDFPSPANAILNLTVFHTSPTGETSIYRSEGIVADGITSVGYETPSGEVVGETRVHGNAFRIESAPPVGAVKGLVGLDTSGRIVHSASFVTLPPRD